MTPSTQNIIETSGSKLPYGTEMFGNFGAKDGDTPISSSQTCPVSHCWRVTLRNTARPPAVAYTNLRCAQHQESFGETRRRGAVHFEMADGKLA